MFVWVADDFSLWCVVVPFLRSTVASGVKVIEVPEVIEAADELDKRLAHPPVTGNNWGTVNDRLDDVMRNKLRDLFGAV